MIASRLMLAASLSVALGGGAARAAAGPAPEPGPAPGAEGRCSLGHAYNVMSIKPYRVEQHDGYTDYTQLRGAEMYVAAEPGLTREWLQRVLAGEIAAGTCDFGVRDATVDVVSAVGGFFVRVSGPDERSANEILRRAHQIVIQ